MSFPTLFDSLPENFTNPTRTGSEPDCAPLLAFAAPSRKLSTAFFNASNRLVLSVEPIGPSIEPDTSNTSVKSIGWVVVTVVVLEAPFTSTFTV